MRYKCSFHHVEPSPDGVFIPSFVRSTRKTIKRKVYSDDGKSFVTEDVTVPVVQAIPHEEFENVGLSCDLFTVENQLAEGRDITKNKPITTPFFGMTLDQRSYAMAELEGFDYDSLLEQPEKKEENVINFND